MAYTGITPKIAVGSKSDIQSSIESEKIGPGAVIITDNNEAAFVRDDKTVSFLKETIGEDIQVNGVNIGNLTDGKTISKDLTVAQFIKQMVQKAIPASYTQPAISLVNNGGQAAGNVEAGSSVSVKLRANFTKNDAGNLTSIVIKKGSEQVANGSSTPLDYTSAENIVVGDETVSFTATASYAEGQIKNNNLGEPSPDGHITAGSKTSSAYSITGKRNLFYGTGVGATPEINSATVRGLTNKRLSPANGNVITINVAVGQQYVIIAYPATLRDITQIKYEETNDIGALSKFTKTQVQVADARGGSNGLMNYKVYSYGMAVPAPAAMTFTVTI